jgi:hypothetical protein
MLAKDSGSWVTSGRWGVERQEAMVFTAIHMAAGMLAAGVAGLAICTLMSRGWRWIPVAMTAGAIWAILPDLPAMFRNHLQGLPMAGVLGSDRLEAALQSWGNVFFAHRVLQEQMEGMSAWGLTGWLVLAGLCIAGLVIGVRRELGQASDDMKLAAYEAGRRMYQVRSSHLSRSA